MNLTSLVPRAKIITNRELVSKSSGNETNREPRVSNPGHAASSLGCILQLCGDDVEFASDSIAGSIKYRELGH